MGSCTVSRVKTSCSLDSCSHYQCWLGFLYLTTTAGLPPPLLPGGPAAFHCPEPSHLSFTRQKHPATQPTDGNWKPHSEPTAFIHQDEDNRSWKLFQSPLRTASSPLLLCKPLCRPRLQMEDGSTDPQQQQGQAHMGQLRAKCGPATLAQQQA